MPAEAMSREQWIEKLLDDAQRALASAVAASVDEMIARGALTVGPMRTWTVVFDDPAALQRYEFEGVAAPTPEIAMRKGTFLGVLQDPNATMPAGAPEGGRPLAEREIIAAALSADAGTTWATATETTPGGGSDGEAG